jgi:3'(2'), 5'-bisphosphate nucleotidase
MNESDLSTAALRAVVEACSLARSVQRNLRDMGQMAKEDKSPVTVADFAVQAIVAISLRQSLGESLIVGEEHADDLRRPEQGALRDSVLDAMRTVHPEVRPDEVLEAIDSCNHDGSATAYWTLDPIDGTKGFLRGQQYAIALARIERGAVVLGVMGCPNLPMSHQAALDRADPSGLIYVASAGGGAWEHDTDSVSESLRRIRASNHDANHPVRVCESVEAGHSKQDETARILRELGEPGAPARLDSQCKYAVVARGQADAYLRLPTGKGYVEKIWDHAAGAIIAQEAGAIVTDVSGAPLDFTHGRRLEHNRGIVCAARGLHERIIEVIDRLGIGAAV